MKNLQPKALFYLSYTEFFERFGFYTVQAMLVLYLIEKLNFQDVRAYGLLGEFTSLSFIMPLLGGWMADVFLGHRWAIFLGAFCQCLGYALLALGAVGLWPGLAFIVLGVGLLKPNISSFLGDFYEARDPRRASGFTLFYVILCAGISLAMFLAGVVQRFMGWSACFGLSSVALIMGMVVFHRGYQVFDKRGIAPQKIEGFFKILRIMLGLMLFWVMVYELIRLTDLQSQGEWHSMWAVVINNVTYGFGILFYGYISVYLCTLKGVERARLVVILILFFISVMFWALFFQMFFIVNVFTERVLNRELFGVNIPASVFLGLETVFLLALGPWVMRCLRSMQKTLPISIKFAWVMGLMGLSMQCLHWITPTYAFSPSALWLLLVYALMALADVLFVPAGLAMITEYTPAKRQGLMMGGLFMSVGFGGKLTGFLASLASIQKGVVNLSVLNPIYRHAFQVYAWIGFSTAIVCVLLTPLIQYLLRDNQHDKRPTALP